MISKPIYVLDTMTKRPKKKRNYGEILEFDSLPEKVSE